MHILGSHFNCHLSEPTFRDWGPSDGSSPLLRKESQRPEFGPTGQFTLAAYLKPPCSALYRPYYLIESSQLLQEGRCYYHESLSEQEADGQKGEVSQLQGHPTGEGQCACPHGSLRRCARLHPQPARVCALRALWDALVCITTIPAHTELPAQAVG